MSEGPLYCNTDNKLSPAPLLCLERPGEPQTAVTLQCIPICGLAKDPSKSASPSCHSEGRCHLHLGRSNPHPTASPSTATQETSDPLHSGSTQRRPGQGEKQRPVVPRTPSRHPDTLSPLLAPRRLSLHPAVGLAAQNWEAPRASTLPIELHTPCDHHGVAVARSGASGWFSS